MISNERQFTRMVSAIPAGNDRRARVVAGINKDGLVRVALKHTRSLGRFKRSKLIKSNGTVRVRGSQQTTILDLPVERAIALKAVLDKLFE